MKIYWRNLFSVRIWIGVAITAAILLSLAEWLLGKVGIPTHVSQYLGYPIAAFVLFISLLGEAVICPRCGKSVKRGYVVCAYCGHDQTSRA